MTLAFYQAKLGERSGAEKDIQTAEERGATDLESQFMKAQALAVLGNKEEALKTVLSCLDQGLAPMEVELALDLNAVRADPRYRKRAQRHGRSTVKANS